MGDGKDVFENNWIFISSFGSESSKENRYNQNIHSCIGKKCSPLPDFSLNCLIKSSPRRIFLSNILDKGGLAKFLLSLSLSPGAPALPLFAFKAKPS